MIMSDADHKNDCSPSLGEPSHNYLLAHDNHRRVSYSPPVAKVTRSVNYFDLLQAGPTFLGELMIFLWRGATAVIPSIHRVNRGIYAVLIPSSSNYC